MVATAIYSVTMVLWKETALPLCRAMERRWKRNVVSRVSYYYYYESTDNSVTVTRTLQGRHFTYSQYRRVMRA